jgi:MscS family membrane protein
MTTFFSAALIWQMMLIVCISAVAAFFARKIIGYCRLSSKKPTLLTSFCDILYPASTQIIAAFGILIALQVLAQNNPFYVEKIIQVRSLLVVSILTWLSFKWKPKLEKVIVQNLKKKKIATDHVLISAIDKIITVLIIVIAGTMILDILGVPLHALLAFGGVSGIAISWAAKDVVANFFGGLMIFINRPFAIGNRICSPNKNFEGDVEHIGWYMTKLRNLDQRPLYIPNALITDAIIENVSRTYNRRIRTTIGVRYDDIDKIKSLREKIEMMLKEHPEIDQNKETMVHLVEFGPYSLNIMLSAYTTTPDFVTFLKIREEVYLSVADIITSCGADIAFPTQTLHVKKSDQS